MFVDMHSILNRKKEVQEHAIDVVIEAIPLEKYGVEEVK